MRELLLSGEIKTALEGCLGECLVKENQLKNYLNYKI